MESQSSGGVCSVDDVCSQKSSTSGEGGIGGGRSCRGDLGKEGGVSYIKRADEVEAEELECDVQKREKEDRARLNAVRTLFYQLNERFE